MIVSVIIVFVSYLVGVAVSAILDAKLTKGTPPDRGPNDQYFALLSWIAVLICSLLYFVDYIYNKFHK